MYNIREIACIGHPRRPPVNSEASVEAVPVGFPIVCSRVEMQYYTIRMACVSSSM